MKRYRLVVMLVAGLLFVGTAAGISSLPRQQVGSAPWDRAEECIADHDGACEVALTAGGVLLHDRFRGQTEIPWCTIAGVSVAADADHEGALEAGADKHVTLEVRHAESTRFQVLPVSGGISARGASDRIRERLADADCD